MSPAAWLRSRRSSRSESNVTELDNLLEQAEAAFRATTIKYADWKRKADAGQYADVKTTKWWQGFNLLAQAKALDDPPPPPPPPPPATSTAAGVYVGARNVSGADAFKSTYSPKLSMALDWCAGDSWGAIEGGWSLTPWKGKYRVILSVPGWPDGSGGTLARGSLGEYDIHWTRLAQRLKADGQTDTIIRPMWESGGTWASNPWGIRSTTDADNFGRYFLRIVAAMRAVAPFEFDWNTITGPPIDPALSYPGDVVTYVTFDLYDTKWGHQGTPAERFKFERERQYGINYLMNFAAQHGKPLGCDEWGLVHADDQGGRGGGDNVYFIDAMADLFAEGDFAYQAYFQFDAPDGRHKLGSQFPQATERFQRRFS